MPSQCSIPSTTRRQRWNSSSSSGAPSHSCSGETVSPRCLASRQRSNNSLTFESNGMPDTENGRGSTSRPLPTEGGMEGHEGGVPASLHGPHRHVEQLGRIGLAESLIKQQPDDF